MVFGVKMWANRGELTAIVGDNGAGKSTLISASRASTPPIGVPSVLPERRSPTAAHRRRGTTASRPSIRVVSGIPTDQARKEDVVAMITGLHESTPQRNR